MILPRLQASRMMKTAILVPIKENAENMKIPAFMSSILSTVSSAALNSNISPDKII